MSIEDIDSQYHIEHAADTTPSQFYGDTSNNSQFLLDNILQFELDAVNRLASTQATAALANFTSAVVNQTDVVVGNSSVPSGNVYVGEYRDYRNFPGGSESVYWNDGDDAYLRKDQEITVGDIYFTNASGGLSDLKMEDFWATIKNRESIKTYEDFFIAFRDFLDSNLNSTTVYFDTYRSNGSGASEWESSLIKHITGIGTFPSDYHVRDYSGTHQGNYFREINIYVDPANHPEYFTKETSSIDVSALIDLYGNVPIDQPLDFSALAGTIQEPITNKYAYNYFDEFKWDLITSWGLMATDTTSTPSSPTSPEVDYYADWAEVLNVVAQAKGITDINVLFDTVVENSFGGFIAFARQKLETETLDYSKLNTLYAEFCKTTTHIENEPGEHSFFVDGVWVGDRREFASFETAFHAFRPDATHADFVNELAAVMLTQLSRNEDDPTAYFNPTHLFEPWIDHLKAPVIGGISPFTENDLSHVRADQARILNEVFELLIEMIGIIQRAATSQAGRLSFFGEWQKEYTDALAAIHVYHKGDSTHMGTGDSGLLSQMQASHNAVRENLRAYRDIIGDEVRQQQQTVNQLHDAASQQANIASSILQQLEGILTLIFR